MGYYLYTLLEVGIILAIFAFVHALFYAPLKESFDHPQYPYQSTNKIGILGIISLAYSGSLLCMFGLYYGVGNIPGNLSGIIKFFYFLTFPGVAGVLTQIFGYMIVWGLRKILPPSILYLSFFHFFLLLIGYTCLGGIIGTFMK